ncbi:MAG TPA: type II toxin-antitoxin system PemK/MazF family toxin [Anaerolineae bacterium]|nr:type II toxin-antitoxin system PemK/MazF family toxin [Anaerolineae bacterium]HQI87193.1 type II toxin-antitoxin system PemK/MazF family toxin [Anaerolineae bacterium]
MKQGEIYWYPFPAPDKRRPVLILTRTSALRFLSSVTVAPITTTIRGIPTEVVLGPQDGLATDCAVNLDNIQTIQKARLGAFIATLATEKMQAVKQAIHFALGMDECASY